MLNDRPLRSSLQVAGATYSRSRCGNGLDQTSAAESHSQSQMTPPLTPNGSQEDFDSMPAPLPVFHNFLRAVFPFHPSCATIDSTVTLALDEGDLILVHSIHTNGWADGTLLASGARGWLPTNYCDAYDPEEMLTLLKSLLNFWDLLRSTSVNDSEMFGNQEFIKGLIAGVRYLLERTHCLTRESTVLQRHESLRRCRKSMLSELSSLVKTAKYLQEKQKQTGPAASASGEINDIIDQMILKAFKIVVKGMRFLDAIDEDRRARVPAIDIMDTVLEEACVPPTPPADPTGGGRKQGRGLDARSRGGADPAQSETGDVTQAGPGNRLLVAHKAGTNGGSRGLSQKQVNRLSTGISHRVSLAGPSPLSQPQNLVSERLNSCHDAFLSHLGSFIGRLQLHSQSRPQLAFAIKQSASSGIDLLSVVDVVCAHNTSSIDALDESRGAMYDRIHSLVHTARRVLTDGGPEMEDVIASQDNGRLLGVATRCVKATGECVAKTKWVIEKMGDFEFEFGSQQVRIDLDLSALDMIPEYRSTNGDSVSVVGSCGSEATTHSSTSTPTSIVSPRRGLNWSVDKPLPDIPPVASVRETVAPARETAPCSQPTPRWPLILDDNASNMPSTMSSLRPQLPPLPRLSTSLLPAPDMESPIEPITSHESEVHSVRSGSTTASSSGSAITFLSRDSESSLASLTSTRATTPDHVLSLRDHHFPSDLSSTSGSVLTDDVDDYVESKLLERTYAHELIFNKEGQVTGGSLPALVERLTTPESTPDAMFVSTFYLTFRLFCTPRQLAEALIDRFDYVGETPNIAGPVRLRTHNAFKGWLESHWRHETDHAALSLIQPFAQDKLSAVFPSAGKRLLELTEKVSTCKGPLVPRLVSSMGKTNTSILQYIPTDTPLPAPIMAKSQIHLLANWKAGGSFPSILDFDPLEIARQLTIRQMGMFCRIMPEELLGSKWTKRGGIGAPNVKAMVSFTTGLSNLVADTVLHYEEVKRRAGVIKHWIKVANQCLVLHNYDALMAITCALTDTSIKRLRFTWDNVSAKRKETLKSLQSVVDLNQNYKVLRARLHDHVPPCLPFLGMFLTDLTFVDVGNLATKTTDTGLTVINFDKHMRTAKCIGELQRFQIPFRLTELPEFQDWMKTQFSRVQQKDAPDSNAQVTHYRKSLLLEPREVHHVRTPLEVPGANPASRFGWMRNNSQSMAPPSPI